MAVCPSVSLFQCADDENCFSKLVRRPSWHAFETDDVGVPQLQHRPRTLIQRNADKDQLFFSNELIADVVASEIRLHLGSREGVKHQYLDNQDVTEAH